MKMRIAQTTTGLWLAGILFLFIAAFTTFLMLFGKLPLAPIGLVSFLMFLAGIFIGLSVERQKPKVISITLNQPRLKRRSK